MGIKKVLIRGAAEAMRVSLNEAFQEFIDVKEAKQLSPDTIRNYSLSYEMFLRFNELDGDETSTDEVESSMVYKWMNTMSMDGVKHTSINHYLRDIRAFLYWCMDSDREYIKSFKIDLVSGQEEDIKLFEDEDIELLLEKPKRTDSFADWRMWTIVSWVLATGSRSASIVNVKMGDIDFRKKEVKLRHTKNKKLQKLPISAELESVLKEYIRIWRSGASDEYWLFPNIGEEQLTTCALRQAFTRYCTSRGVKRHNIHGLRHNFAKYWLQSNGNMFTLQQILGHSSLEMTKKYVKIFTSDIKEGYEKHSPLDNLRKAGKRRQAVQRNMF